MSRPVETLVGGDFLALVRLGLRRADDARIVDSVTVLDGELRAELPTGVAYYRYSGDGYGEHADGSGFDGTGLGRPWPLLAGERGLYAAQAGQDASRYVESMMAMTGRGGLFPEQVWDGPEVAERGLWPGHPTGSAMPLVWAHGEFVKLATLAPAGRPIETLEAVVDQRHADATWWHWRADVTFDAVAPGVGVVIDLDAAAVIEHGSRHERTDPIGLGRWGVHLGPQDPLGRYEVVFEDPRRERLIIDLARSA
jgi:glucoamylase